MASKDVIIIGAGHNGLTCAAYLARAGFAVTVLEANAQVGGAAVTEEFEPHYRVSSGAHLLSLLDPRLEAELSLSSHGLRAARSNLETIALSPNGDHLGFAGSRVTGDLSAGDQAAFSAYQGRMRRFAEMLRDLYDRAPPRLAATPTDLWGLGRLAVGIRRLGKEELREFLRIAGINVFDVLNETFASELLKGALAFDAVLGAHLGPRSNNSVLSALHRLTGEFDGVRGNLAIPVGGMGAVSAALAAAASKAGAEVQTETAVTSILINGGCAVGVELEDGRQMRADIIVSNADPKRTFLQLVGPANLEAGFAARISNIRCAGVSAKLHLALRGLPTFTGLSPDRLAGRLLIAPDLGYVERSFDHAKYGEYSEAPVVEITLPTVSDPSLAPDGHHVLSAVVQYAPYRLKDGWQNSKQAFQQLVIDTIEEYAPDLPDQIVAGELLTPVDLEQRFGVTGGHWHHGELALDQFLMLRPVAGAAQYASPVPGLYLCGAGCHPGGGVMGSAGRNAAMAIKARER